MNLTAELTKRETEIARMLAWGASKKEIAAKLYISVYTVENTARNIFAKLEIKKATELCVWWFVTKCGVSIDLDPLKRKIIALCLLAVFLPQELSAHGNTLFRARRTRTETRVRARRNRDNESTFLDFEL